MNISHSSAPHYSILHLGIVNIGFAHCLMKPPYLSLPIQKGTSRTGQDQTLSLSLVVMYVLFMVLSSSTVRAGMFTKVELNRSYSTKSAITYPLYFTKLCKTKLHSTPQFHVQCGN